MAYIEVLLLTIFTYFIGSLPVYVLFSKFFYGIDIREHGNGENAWQNIASVIGKKQGFAALLLEKLKIGVIPFFALIGALQWGWFERIEYPFFLLLLGLAAIAGAHFPMFRDSKKGKHFLFAFAGKHVLNVGAVLICVCLGWDMYYIFSNESLFFELINTGFAVGAALSDTAIQLYIYAIITIFVAYFFYKSEFQNLFAHIIPRKLPFSIRKDRLNRRK